MNEKPVFDIKVKIGETTEVLGKTAEVYFVRFSGEVNSPIFTGKTMPDAVDTQMRYSDGRATLSARYILAGVDSGGRACRVFIENNGAADDGKTTPVIITDSPALKYLETAKLSGKISSRNGDLIIQITEEI